MDTLLIQDKFRAMGADIQFEDESTRKSFKLALINYRLGYIKTKPALPEKMSIDIKKVEGKEVFVVDTYENPHLTVSVLDLREKERHLLLMVKNAAGKPADQSGGTRITKYLCGHDERHWFVASVPEKAHAKTVHEAKTALKPQPVVLAEKRAELKTAEKSKRRNQAYIRQGEWFFIPQPNLQFSTNTLILKREPLTRGNGSKPHIAEEAVRTGGAAVWVHPKLAPFGISEKKYKEIIQKKPGSKSSFRKMVRAASVFVRGWVRHPDHKTIHLPCWHAVYMNTENEAMAGRNLVFLD